MTEVTEISYTYRGYEKQKSRNFCFPNGNRVEKFLSLLSPLRPVRLHPAWSHAHFPQGNAISRMHVRQAYETAANCTNRSLAASRFMFSESSTARA